MAISAFLSAAYVTGCQHEVRTTSFKFIDAAVLAPPVDASELGIEKNRTIFVDAEPIEPLKRPSWPDVKPPRASLPLTLKVRILVDEEGAVGGVMKSVADVSIPSPFSSS